MKKTLARAFAVTLVFTMGLTHAVSATGVAPVINNVCINRTTGILRTLRTSPLKSCEFNEVKVRANKVCVNKVSGRLRHLASNVKQVCRQGEIKLIWNPSIAAIRASVTNASPLTSPATSPIGSTTSPIGSTPSAGSTTQTTVVANPPTRTFAYKVGDVGPGGGLIFVDALSQFDGFTYLEAAPVDLPAAAWATNSVGCFDGTDAATSCLDASVYQVSQANSSRINAAKIGQGSVNTALIRTRLLAGGPVDNTTFAAGLADAYVYGAVTDWYLPSINELGLMHANLKAKGLGNFQDISYWSSTEFGTNSAWYIYFPLGHYTEITKSFRFAVRPIRSFG